MIFFQITSIANAAYECKWTNSKISSRTRTAIIMIIQISQKGQLLQTGGGLIKFDLENFVRVSILRIILNFIIIWTSIFRFCNYPIHYLQCIVRLILRNCKV